MNKLLSANFARLFRDKIFWICMILMAIISGYVYMSAVSDMRTWNVIISPEDNLFGFSTFTAIFQSVFISIFVGTEYNDGTMRNKLAIGHSRAAIYLSNMIVCAAAGLLMCLVYMAVALAIGLLAIGGFEAAPLTLAVFTAAAFLMSIAFSAIFTFVAMLIQNRSLSAVINIVGIFAFLMLSVYITSALSEPETASVYTYVAGGDGEGNDEMIEINQPNPHYVDGAMRDVYTFINDFLPTGQSISLTAMHTPYPQRLCVYSVIIISGVSAGGIVIFRRKNIR